MCGLFSINRDISELTKLFPDIKVEDALVCGRIHPKSSISTVYKGCLRKLFWGFKSDTITEPLINIRAEGIASKPWFRKHFYKNRCLIPADAFYEWKESVQDGRKIPYRFSMKDNSIFFMAGLVNENNGTCAIITTTPCFLVKSVHNRMPVIIDRSKTSLWLSNSTTDTELILPLFSPFDSGKISMAQTDL